MNILIMGPQGSGKTTQVKFLAKHLGLPFISTGGLSREVMKEETELGKKVRSFHDRGILIPDEIMLQILKSELKKPIYEKGFVIEGFPRNFWQLKNNPFKIDEVFFLRISDEVGIERLLKRAKIEHRSDDTEEVIRARLERYHRQTEPLLKAFCDKGLLVEIDAERSVEEIFAEIVSSINSKCKAQNAKLQHKTQNI